MKAAVIVFPGSNCDRDMKVALAQALGTDPLMVWHQDADFPAVDFIALPGGFSYGDYLRCGAMSANSPVMREVVKRAKAGVHILGVCNGFQILTEAGLLPGALMRNAGIKFICKDVTLKVERADTPFTQGYGADDVIRIPVAHHDGNYFADADMVKRIEDNNQVAFRYCDANGTADARANINGSQANIAGLLNEAGNVLGMMPHPERMISDQLGGTNGAQMFKGLVEALS